MKHYRRAISGIMIGFMMAVDIGYAEPEGSAPNDLIDTEFKSAREALSNQDFRQAAQWLQKSAEKGFPQAQFYLGLLYEEGQGLERSYQEAALWYRKAAESGLAEAQYNLANLYDKGLGVDQDHAQAIKWFRKAAGAALAQVSPPPPGTERKPAATRREKPKRQASVQDQPRPAANSPAQLAARLQQRASQGDPEAQYKLGELFENGNGVPRDPVVAEQWKRMALSRGYKP